MDQEKTKIMIVDDTPANLKILAEILYRQGYHVLAFPSGPAALRALQKSLPDLILLDIMMPEMDGFDVCRILKNDTALRSIPVIFISARDDTTSKIRAFAEGGVDYVVKPFQEDVLLARVRTHLHLHCQKIQIEKQKKKLQENYDRLMVLENMRDSLVHMVAHDMNSPLMGIMGYAELLGMELQDSGNETLYAMTRKLSASAQTLQRMIMNLLDISRLEADKMPTQTLACEPDQLIQNALDVMEPLLLKTELLWKKGTVGEKVLCDPDLSLRVLENLIGNAIKHGGEKSRITLAVSSEEAFMKFSVTDTGPGIPSDCHNSIFEKYAQVPDKTKRRPYGTGLGLAFCMLAVESQGGKIGFDSREGEGATFWFSLPSTTAFPS